MQCIRLSEPQQDTKSYPSLSRTACPRNLFPHPMHTHVTCEKTCIFRTASYDKRPNKIRKGKRVSMPLTRSHYLLQDEVAFIIIVYICVCTIRLHTTHTLHYTQASVHIINIFGLPKTRLAPMQSVLK